MSYGREIQWGLFAQRVFAFVVDTILFITMFTLLIRTFNIFMPGHDVREDPMQLYTEKDFRVFVATAVVALVLLALYMLFSYRSKRGQTIGHRLARVRITTRSGDSLGAVAVLRITAIAWARILLLVVPGPVIAFYGGTLIWSLYALIWAIFVTLPIPVSRSTGATFWEIAGNYKFTKYESKQIEP